MTTLLFMSGSQRRESFNSRLLANLAQRLEGRCLTDIIQPIDLPLFNQDLEDSPTIIGQVAALHQRIRAADGLIVASPEYNGQMTPYLVNIVAWVSRLAYYDSRFENPFCDRPLVLCSASTGHSGGAAGMSHARALFHYVGSLIVDDSICVPYAHEAWTGRGYEFDPFCEEQIDSVMARFLQQIHQPAMA